MAIHPTIFGWRVRSWAEDTHCTIDWCGGADQHDVERLYSILYNILSHREESKEALDDLPTCSKVKPYINDAEFLSDILNRLTAPFEIIKLENLINLRHRIFDDYKNYINV